MNLLMLSLFIAAGKAAVLVYDLLYSQCIKHTSCQVIEEKKKKKQLSGFLSVLISVGDEDVICFVFYLEIYI